MVFQPKNKDNSDINISIGDFLLYDTPLASIDDTDMLWNSYPHEDVYQTFINKYVSNYVDDQDVTEEISVLE